MIWIIKWKNIIYINMIATEILLRINGMMYQENLNIKLSINMIATKKRWNHSDRNKMEKYYLYKYDRDGNLVEDKWYDVSGKLEYKIVNKYDSNEKKMESFSYGEDGKLLSRYSYRYNDKGNIVEEAEFNSNDKPVGIVQYIYKFY